MNKFHHHLMTYVILRNIWCAILRVRKHVVHVVYCTSVLFGQGGEFNKQLAGLGFRV